VGRAPKDRAGDGKHPLGSVGNVYTLVVLDSSSVLELVASLMRPLVPHRLCYSERPPGWVERVRECRLQARMTFQRKRKAAGGKTRGGAKRLTAREREEKLFEDALAKRRGARA